MSRRVLPRWLAVAALAVMVIGLQAHVSQRVSAASIVVNSLADTAHIADNGAGGGVAGDAIRNGTETISTVCDADPGPPVVCTLRAAVYMANANGDTVDTITFFAGLSGTITLGTLTLPLGPCGTITAASCGANLVVDNTMIDGPTAGPDPVITVDCTGGTTAAFTVSGASNTIRDLNIVGCSTAAIVITGEPADNNKLLGNYIGTNATGTACSGTPNFQGVAIAQGADFNLIGTATPADRNVISCSANDGIVLSGDAATNTILGNYIGSDSSGNVALGNGGVGIIIQDTAHNNTIGGTRPSNPQCAAPCNVIVANGGQGVALFNTATDNVISGNNIGLGADGITGLGSGSGSGVWDGSSGTGNQVGGSGATMPTSGTCSGPCNIIAYNSSSGVSIFDAAARTSIRGNSMFLNAPGDAAPGIDLDNNAAVDCTGATANGSVDCPVITGVVLVASQFSVFGTCDAGATIDVYQVTSTAPPSVNGPGGLWLGSGTCSALQAFNVAVCPAGPTPATLTATQTRTLGSPATSEFATNVDSPSGSCTQPAPTATPTPTQGRPPTPTPRATNTPRSTPTPRATNTPRPTPGHGPPPTRTPTPTP